MFRVLARNVSSNWAGLAVQVGITFFLTPFVLDCLGGHAYGVWVLVTSVTGYYGLLTMGLGAGTTQQLTKAFAGGDLGRFNSVISTSVFAMVVAGGCICLAAFVAALYAPAVFSVSESLLYDMRTCIVITGAASGIQFGLFPFTAVFTAKQRYDVSNAIGIVTRLISAFLTVVVLRRGGGLVETCAVIAFADVLGSVWRWRVAHQLIPGLRIAWRLVDRSSANSLFQFSLWNTLGTAGQRLIGTAGILVVGVFMTEDAVAPYAMAANIVRYFTQMLGATAIVFYPAAAELFSNRNQARIRRLYLGGSKFLFLVALTGGIPAALWARDFYALWIPDKLAEWTAFPPIENVFVALLLGAILSSGMLVGEQLVLGAHRLGVTVGLTVSEGLLSVAFSSIAVHAFGLIGIALGTTSASILIRFIVCPVVVGRIVGVPATTYLWSACFRPAVIGALLVPVLHRIHEWTPSTTWTEFFLSASLAAAVAAIVSALLGLTHDERNRFIARPTVVLGRRLGLLKNESAISTEPN